MVFKILSVAWGFGKSFILSKLIEMIADQVIDGVEEFTRKNVLEWMSTLSEKYPSFISDEVEEALLVDVDQIITLTEKAVREVLTPNKTVDKNQVAAKVMTDILKSA